MGEVRRGKVRVVEVLPVPRRHVSDPFTLNSPRRETGWGYVLPNPPSKMSSFWTDNTGNFNLGRTHLLLSVDCVHWVSVRPAEYRKGLGRGP